MVLKQKTCYFDTSKENLIAEYRFLQDESRLQDGVPLILPCTTGGEYGDTFISIVKDIYKFKI